MSTDPILLRAILAMDAYNQGYGQGVLGVGNQIGEANRTQDSQILRDANDQRLDQPAGFYAVAYTLADGSKVISYRGTDQLTATPFSSRLGEMKMNYV
jgi:hypothetical protein